MTTADNARREPHFWLGYLQQALVSVDEALKDGAPVEHVREEIQHHLRAYKFSPLVKQLKREALIAEEVEVGV